ncbi:MAG TPA: hypothetical protein VN577_02845 [Terriglobales bacterium]|nr:hypothetical protein [Terriglobales bacterium]
MSNREFLYAWFPLSWVIAAAVSAIVVALLWRLVQELALRFGGRFRRFMQVMFPAGIVLPIFAGFLSISYYEQSCYRYSSSTEVIRDRSHLVWVAESEMAAIAEHLVYVLFVWAALYTVLVAVWKRMNSSQQ